MSRTVVDQIIASRKTSKTLGDPDKKFVSDPNFDQLVAEAIEVAQWAPFHYPCHKMHCSGEQSSIVPWRFYHLDSKNCNRLIDQLVTIGKNYPDNPSWSNVGTGKISQMLAAAGAMIQVAWLPDPPYEISTSVKEAELEKRNTEHLAAAGAAVQNLLLSAESKGLNSYWSSGGRLRETEVFELLEIPQEQKMLGCIFLYPREQDNIEVLSGKLRDKRGEPKDWCRDIKIK